MAPLKTFLFPPTLGAINSLGNLNLPKPLLETALWLLNLGPGLGAVPAFPTGVPGKVRRAGP